MYQFSKVILEDPKTHDEPIAGTIIRQANPSVIEHLQDSVFSKDGQFRLYGRPVGPKVNVGLVQDWIQFCERQNNECRQSHSAQTALEYDRIRLIDVQDKRTVNSSLDEEYLALSYVWGKDTQSLLTRKTFGSDSFLAEGSLEEMIIPRIIANAMTLVQTLGKRYLWVDSACIVQNDFEDKKRKLPLMAKIYGGAFPVIVAAGGSEAYAGTPGISAAVPRDASHARETIDGIQFTAASPSLQETLSITTWSTRGWTFEEAMLSRRALIFTEQQVYWSCLAEAWREYMYLESESLGVTCTTKNTIRRSFGIGHDPRTGQVRDLCAKGLYRRLAKDFSTWSLKEEEDVLWAFAGILEHLAPSIQEGFI